MLLRAIIVIKEVVERVRMLQLLLLANYFALFILLFIKVPVLIIIATAARRGVLEIHLMVILRRRHIIRRKRLRNLLFVFSCIVAMRRHL